MTEEFREKLNKLELEQLEKIRQTPVGSKESLIATRDLKTLVEIDIADYEAANKAYKDEAMLKRLRWKSIMDNSQKVAGYIAYGFTTVFIVYVSNKGLFIDKSPLPFLFKPKV